MSRKSLGLSFFILVMVALSLVFVPILVADNTPTLTISDIGVSKSIVEFPIVGKTWAIDAWESKVGHLDGTASVTNTGNIVLAAHSTYPDGKAGPFYNLYQLSVGADIVLFDGSAERHYSVVEIKTVSKYDLSVVSATNDDRLTLITCEVDSYDAATQTYSNRLIVVAQRVS